MQRIQKILLLCEEITPLNLCFYKEHWRKVKREREDIVQSKVSIDRLEITRSDLYSEIRTDKKKTTTWNIVRGNIRGNSNATHISFAKTACRHFYTKAIQWVVWKLIKRVASPTRELTFEHATSENNWHLTHKTIFQAITMPYCVLSLSLPTIQVQLNYTSPSYINSRQPSSCHRVNYQFEFYKIYDVSNWAIKSLGKKSQLIFPTSGINAFCIFVIEECDINFYKLVNGKIPIFFSI